MRWEPLHGMVVWQARAQRLHSVETSGWAPAVDVYETDDAFCVSIELAGFKPDDFHVQATDESVTISGQRSAESAGAQSAGAQEGPSQFLQVERGLGAFTRRFKFPHPIAVGNVSATYRDGLLAVKIPKLARPLAKTVGVSA
jgi:HSP20 family protein